MEAAESLISAVIICAPPPVADFVRGLRALHAGTNSAAHVVPPHITVMYPFVSPGPSMDAIDGHVLAETNDRLRSALQEVPPFTLALDRYGTFPGRVLYLALQDAGPLLRLYHHLLAAFPAYPLYRGDYSEIIPHLTVSVVDSQEALDSLARPPFEPLSFEVNELHFMYGDPLMIHPWKTAAVLPLGVQE
ncbi:MAG: 2'-5' RNA ligase family protein [Anaerolineae bacterium]|nr:2'-5' RNA ligase family protein [Anaerolineae bacterium]